MKSPSTQSWLAAALLASAATCTPIQSFLPPGTTAPNGAGLHNPVSHVSAGGSTLCVSGTVQVHASTSNNLKFDFDLPKNQTQVTQTIVDLFTAGSTLKQSITRGTQNVSGTYSIGATLCLPADTKTTKIQVLTHGIGYDRRYWDITHNYSYVDVVAAAGYATFFYDRLGVGKSSKPDAIQVVQSPLELSILESIISLLRDGKIGGRAYKTVVGVGHSFGSIITQGLSATSPKSLDAVVLTGFSTNSTGIAPFSLAQNLAIAAENNPTRWGSLSNGYLVVDTPISGQSTFLHAQGFSPELFELSNIIKNTVTLGEELTTLNIIQRAEQYSGPVAVVAGNNDFGFCAGNCSYPSNILAELPIALYPKTPAEKTTTYRAPDAGHGLNFHYSAKAAFEFIQDFLSKQGL